MNDEQELQFDKDFEGFIGRPEWFAYTSKPALDLLIERTSQRVEANGGYSSISSFEITFNELVESGAITKFRNVNFDDDDKPLVLTAEQYQRTPSETMQRKYRSDARYKAAVDKLFADGLV